MGSEQAVRKLEGDEREDLDGDAGSDAGDCESGYQRIAAPVDETSEPERRSSRPAWSVVEQFECDGFYYRVSRKPIESTGPRLTKREQQALAYAKSGYSNKRIAHLLGIAPSTVGVLLFRAAAKMGAKSRSDLVRAYARLLSDESE